MLFALIGKLTAFARPDDAVMPRDYWRLGPWKRNATAMIPQSLVVVDGRLTRKVVSRSSPRASQLDG